MRWLLVLLIACKSGDKPPPAADNNEPSIPADEMKRGQDACAAYVEKVCACAETVPAAKDRCQMSKALPDVMKMATEVTLSKDSSPRDVKQATRDIRKTIAECFEQTAKLPELGCKL